MARTQANSTPRAHLSPAKRLRDPILATLDAIQLYRGQDYAHPEDFQLQPLNPVRLLVAYSGGRDSATLLDVLVKLKRDVACHRIASIDVIHVNHGLSPHANEWAQAAEAKCAQYGIPCHVERVFVNIKSGDGLEAAARIARYRAIAKVAKRLSSDVVMTAHHLDDQLETFLIQWMRGAGPEGLTGMLSTRALESDDQLGCLLARPWLSVSGSTIAAYAKRCKLSWVEDESNQDTRILRNLIRNQLLPSFDQVRPGWRQAAMRSIDLLGQASDVILELGQSDAKAVCDEAGAIEIPRFLQLSEKRRAYCLRAWLAQNGVRSPTQARLNDLMRQVAVTQNDTKLVFQFGSKQVRRWSNRLICTDHIVTVRNAELNYTITWRGQTVESLGLWAGELHFVPCGPNEPGIDVKRLATGKLQVRTRRGGEKLKLHPLRPSKNLKYHFQAAGIPSFSRAGLPLIWLNDTLIFVAGLGMDVCAYDDPVLHPERVKLVWVPDLNLLDHLSQNAENTQAIVNPPTEEVTHTVVAEVTQTSSVESTVTIDENSTEKEDVQPEIQTKLF